jgi:hypothetical protein
MSNPKNRVLVIVGMHRSMTSLAAQWLYKCGLHVGDDLYGAGIGNVQGHYEDNDFINLHDHMLKINNSHWRDFSSQSFQFDAYSRQKSRMLIELKSELNEQWGWKDPRTCLFLDHWCTLLPEGRYLIIYRPFAGVVDSFLRREFKVNNRAEYVLEFRKYASKLLNYDKKKEDNLRLWMHYNVKILEFIKGTDKERFLVLRSDQLLKESEQIFDFIKNNWGFELDFTPVKSIYDADITKQASAAALKGVDPALIEKAVNIEEKLGKHCFKQIE